MPYRKVARQVLTFGASALPNCRSQTLAGRTIRVSVAEPRSYRTTMSSVYHAHACGTIAKERLGSYDGVHGDETKFESPWRREGTLSDTRDPRRRYEGLPHGDRALTLSDDVGDWRSTRPPRLPDAETSQTRKKVSGFFTSESQTGNSDKEDTWTIGSKFRPSLEDASFSGTKSGSLKGREMHQVGDPASNTEEGDWRSSTRLKPSSRGSASRTSIPLTCVPILTLNCTQRLVQRRRLHKWAGGGLNYYPVPPMHPLALAHSPPQNSPVRLVPVPLSTHSVLPGQCLWMTVDDC